MITSPRDNTKGWGDSLTANTIHMTWEKNMRHVLFDKTNKIVRLLSWHVLSQKRCLRQLGRFQLHRWRHSILHRKMGIGEIQQTFQSELFHLEKRNPVQRASKCVWKSANWYQGGNCLPRRTCMGLQQHRIKLHVCAGSRLCARSLMFTYMLLHWYWCCSRKPTDPSIQDDEWPESGACMILCLRLYMCTFVYPSNRWKYTRNEETNN